MKPDMLDPAIDMTARWLRATARALRPLYLSRGHRLLKAAQDNDLPKVQLLLVSGVSPNVKAKAGEAWMHPEVGTTPLHFAVRHGNATMAELLLDAGANPNAARAWGETPWWEWLEKHKDFAYSRHPVLLPPELPENESEIGTALLKHGASMDVCIPPFEPTRTISSMVLGPHLMMVQKLQGEIQSQEQKKLLDGDTLPARKTRPVHRI